jgi:hypothetical protein
LEEQVMTHNHAKLAMLAVGAALLSACGGGGGGGYGQAPTQPPTPPAAANSAPQIAAIANQSGDEGQTMGPVTFSVSDAETAADALQVTATSANPSLLPPDGIDVEGSGATRSLLLTPAPDQAGTTQVTLTVTDAAGATGTAVFDFVVKPLLRADFSGWVRTTVLVRSEEHDPVGAVPEEGASLTAVEDINRIKINDDTAEDAAAYIDLIPPPPEEEESI